MPLIELKTYRAVCDRCGRVGSTWQTLPEEDRNKAIPGGWSLKETSRRRTGRAEVIVEVSLWCDECNLWMVRENERLAQESEVTP